MIGKTLRSRVIAVVVRKPLDAAGDTATCVERPAQTYPGSDVTYANASGMVPQSYRYRLAPAFELIDRDADIWKTCVLTDGPFSEFCQAGRVWRRWHNRSQVFQSGIYLCVRGVGYDE